MEQTRRALVEAEFQLLSDKQSKLDDQEGRKRVTVVMRRGEANSPCVAGSIPSSVSVSSSPHKYYLPASDYAQTVLKRWKSGIRDVGQHGVPLTDALQAQDSCWPDPVAI